MMKKVLSKKKLYFGILASFIIVLTSFFAYTLITGNLSFATSSGWDGVSVASSFSGGNGDITNPYQISSAEEFMYFKELIEGDSFSSFQDSFFSLTNDIDLGNKNITPIGVISDEHERIFNGTFDGNGFTIKNFKIEDSSTINGKEYYALFSKTKDAKICNLNIENFSIKSSSSNDFVSILIGEITTSNDGTEDKTLDDKILSTISNISLSDFYVELFRDDSTDKNISVISNSISDNVLIKNVYLKGTYKNDDNYNFMIVPENVTNITNILFDVKYSGNFVSNLKDGLYTINDKKIYLGEDEISSNSLLSIFNESNDGDFSWIIENDKYFYRKNTSSIIDEVSSSTMMFSLSSRAGAIPVYESGLSSDKETVYINDLESDRNYYTGLNHIDYRTTVTNPNNFGEDMNLYNSSNLVEVHIKYDGHDVNDSDIYGTVSLTEPTINFVYYKYYVVKNGYVEIELIDNPYANRPNGRYFNGWVTDYKDAEIHFRVEDYVRYVRIPVSSTSNSIDITFYTSWTRHGTTGFTSSYSNSISNFSSASFKQVTLEQEKMYDRENTDGLYIEETISWGYYPDGAVDQYGNSREGEYCYGWDDCTFYKPLTSFYDDNDELIEEDFYELKNGLMQRTIVNLVSVPFNLSGYFKRYTTGSSSGNYYGANGIPKTGSCTSSSPCYELIQFYDQYGNENLFDGEGNIYMRVTRDTNIMVLNSSSKLTINSVKPFTLTGINNGEIECSACKLNFNDSSIKNGQDFRLEYVNVYITSTSNAISTIYGVPKSSQNQNIYANGHNLKIGRGISKDSSRKYNFLNVFSGGDNNGNYGNKRMIVESGYYDYSTLTNKGGTTTINITSIWGSDYDRVVNPDIISLNVLHSIVTVSYASGSSNTYLNGKSFLYIKSGEIGATPKWLSSGIYVGGRNGGYMRNTAEIIVEGGKILNIAGGPGSARYNGYSVNNNADIYVFVKGGEINNIFGGANAADSKGNKVISVTGGNVKFSVVGGSNGAQASSRTGRNAGNSYIYIGGNAIIGDETISADEKDPISKTENGSVFGHGNGKQNDNTIGPMTNSNILIDGNAKILKNVYGGSNHGAAGYNAKTTISRIIVKDGTIGGNIFGSGNNNGSGSSSISSEVKIDVYGGIIGNIYGGANNQGTDYGSATINIYGGTIGNVYGGGYGSSTKVKKDVSINIGDSSTSPIEIKGNVYGGSALGSTNIDSNTKTEVVVNRGTIKGSVFGGAMGNSTTTPSVGGDISVVINNGSITNVFGGFDAKGSPLNTKKDTVVVNNGIIGNVFGGGNNTGQTTTDVTINNGTISGSVYGGSNLQGDVTDSAVKINGGTIDSVYGGGNQVGVTNTSINYNNATSKNVYGGSYSKGTVNKSNVVINSGTISESVFGGNNLGGATLDPYVEVNNGTIGNVYGGGNAVASGPSEVIIKNGQINDVFGGGNNAGLNTVSGSNLSTTTTADSNINITGGSIKRVFGGSNNQGDIKNSNISVDMNNSSSNFSSISTNVSIDKRAMEDWEKNNYPEYKDMKTYARIQIGVMNNSETIYNNLGMLLDYSNSVILNSIDVPKTDIDHSKVNNSSIITKYNGNALSLNRYQYIGIQLELFSSVEPDEFKFNAELISLDSSIVELYGGNNAGGKTESSIINAKNASIFYVYGGGNNAPVTASNTKLTNIVGVNAFGGNNVSETTGISEIEATDSEFNNLYGGGNNARNGPSTVIVNSGNYGSVFGGGNAAESGASNVTINNGIIGNVYGGGNSAGLSDSDGNKDSTLNINGGKITNVFGGSNAKGILRESNINIDIEKSQVSTDTPYSDKVKLDISYDKSDVDPSILEANKDNEKYEDVVSYAKVRVTVTNLFSSPINEWDLLFNIPDSIIHVNNSDVTIKEDSTSNNLIRASSMSKSNNGSHHSLAVGGSYTFEFEIVSSVSTRNLSVMGEVTNPNDVYIIGDKFNIINVYGGGNQGNENGHVTASNINAKSGRIVTIYGGGNAATTDSTKVNLNGISAVDVYGGGNMAITNGSTSLNISNSVIFSNIYGGGNQGPVANSTVVNVTDSSINGNAFAGGNGSNAIVNKNSTITIDGNTIIGTEKSIAPNSGCVFGSGNAANNGVEANPALGISEVLGTSTVNFVGGLVYGNVYGGAKMAVVYGNALTKIGTNAVSIDSLKEENIKIIGSVFGGGESNVSGNSAYDANAISVTKGIDVQINGENYEKNSHDFIINGSIFGSGNASNSSGTSVVYIKNLGTKEKPNQALSIQRTKDLTIDSSVIEITGAKDKTNEYSKFQYSFNLIDSLKLVNNSTLLLKRNANVLKTIYSGKYTDGKLEPAVVEINDSTKKVTKNVDNRIYMFSPQTLNVYNGPDVESGYGKITGMTFFGMYTGGSSGYNYGLYDSKYSYGDRGNGDLIIAGGSHINGLHMENHDITKDGFYTNYLDEETYSDISTAYIDPIDLGNNGYRWVIGYPTETYEVYLTAAKFSSLGTFSLGLDSFYKGNVTFNVLGFDSSSMKSGVNLVDYSDVPRVAKTEKEANSTFGLVMKAETQEWTGHGVTKYIGNSFEGDNLYRTDARTGIPSLMFYLYHARNINSDEELGSCSITLQASVPKNAIEDEVKFINIIVYIDSSNKDAVEGYDASITYDKKYELPRFTSVNITNNSQFSAYFSLAEFYDSFEKIYGKENDYYHVITTDRPLPVDTMITMIDFSANPNRPEYYYLKIDNDKYNESVNKLNKKGEVDYRLSDFIKMDSVSPNNTYDDKKANLLYYDEDAHLADEEFIFIFDFKECNVTGSYLNNYILFELRGSDDFRRLGVGRNNEIMYYSTYDSSNVALKQNFSDDPEYLYYDIPFDFNYSTSVTYTEAGSSGTIVSIIDTNYESSSMGINVSFIDKQGETVSSSLLVGTSLIIDDKEYFADGDGVFRIKLTDKVSSVLKNTKLLVNKDLPSGDYTLRYTLFASDDGLHNSNSKNSVTREFDIHVVSSDNYISVESDDKDQIVDGDTGLNLNGTNINKYSVKFSSTLSRKRFRIYVSKRNINDADSNEFEIVPFNSLFKNEFSPVGDGGVFVNMLDYRINNFEFELNDNLVSGTYRISFEMYDNNQLIDQDIKYVIVKKKVE